jgi:hypothetical protein
VSSIFKDDIATESTAISRLLEAAGPGKAHLVTSELTLEEIKKVPPQYRLPLERTFHLLEKVPVARWDELVHLRPISGTKPGPVGPVSVNDPLYGALLELGLDEFDARHLFVAVKRGCDVFVTCDNSRQTGVLRRAAKIQALTGMAVQRPSEFLAAQGW